MPKDKLFNRRIPEYGGEYQNHLLAQYEIYVEMMDRVSQRRMTANEFFIGANTVLITLYGAVTSFRPITKIAVCFIGIIVSFTWRALINSYKQLNTQKFAVIHELEKELPANLYKYEWEQLGLGRNKKVYMPFSHIELVIPFLFIGIYIALILAAVDINPILKIIERVR